MKRIKCLMCGKQLNRTSSRQKYHGSQKMKGTCSWKNNRILCKESHKKRRKLWASSKKKAGFWFRWSVKSLRRGFRLLFRGK